MSRREYGPEDLWCDSDEEEDQESYPVGSDTMKFLLGGMRKPSTKEEGNRLTNRFLTTKQLELLKEIEKGGYPEAPSDEETDNRDKKKKKTGDKSKRGKKNSRFKNT